MLWTPSNEFNFSVDNFGATYTLAGLGTTVTANAAANTKGATTQLISAASLTDNCYGLSLCFTRTNSAAGIVSFLVDIMYDPAGGTNWQILVPNLLVHQPSLQRGGWWFYFPIYIPAGSSLGARCQSSTGASTVQVAARVYGKPSKPELIKYGHKVQALGVNTTTTRGTAFTPGTSALGSYSASLGTLNFDAWWWQVGWTMTDTTSTMSGLLIDVAANATNKILCYEGDISIPDSSENFGKTALGARPPIRCISAGQDVYVRGAGLNTAPDTGMSAAVYAVGH